MLRNEEECRECIDTKREDYIETQSESPVRKFQYTPEKKEEKDYSRPVFYTDSLSLSTLTDDKELDSFYDVKKSFIIGISKGSGKDLFITN